MQNEQNANEVSVLKGKCAAIQKKLDAADAEKITLRKEKADLLTKLKELEARKEPSSRKAEESSPADKEVISQLKGKVAALQRKLDAADKDKTALREERDALKNSHSASSKAGANGTSSAQQVTSDELKRIAELTNSDVLNENQLLALQMTQLEEELTYWFNECRRLKTAAAIESHPNPVHALIPQEADQDESADSKIYSDLLKEASFGVADEWSSSQIEKIECLNYGLLKRIIERIDGDDPEADTRVSRAEIENLKKRPGFDAVASLGEVMRDGYEHLWIGVANLRLPSGRSLKNVNFRVATALTKEDGYSNHPRIEFPKIGKNHLLDGWIENAADEHGSKFEIRMEINPSAIDIEAWRRLSEEDKELVVYLLNHAEKIISTLQTFTRSNDVWADRCKALNAVVRKIGGQGLL